MTKKETYLMGYAILDDMLTFDTTLLSEEENADVLKVRDVLARLYAIETVGDIHSTDVECFGDKMFKRIHLYHEAADNAVKADVSESEHESH